MLYITADTFTLNGNLNWNGLPQNKPAFEYHFNSLLVCSHSYFSHAVSTLLLAVMCKPIGYTLEITQLDQTIKSEHFHVLLCPERL